MKRKGQSAGNSAIFVIVITVVIALYILFLPPSDRAELLGESTGSGGTGGSGGGSNFVPVQQMLLSENVGEINYVSNDEREHTIPSMRIHTSDAGSVIKEVDSLYVRQSVFDQNFRNVSFALDEELTKDVKLSFNIGDSADGRLIILVNNRQLVNDEFSKRTSRYVNIPLDILSRNNVITFAVSSPGWAFWSMNEYQLDTVQVTGTITDVSGAESKQSFYLSEDEYDNIERSRFKYYADCEPQHVGRLHIRVNGKNIFSGLADCGIMNSIELDPWLLDIGENDVSFETEKGSYLMTNLEIVNELKEPQYPIYYFDVDSMFINEYGDDTEICGEVDGVCPNNCNEDLDKDCCFEESDDYYWCDLEPEQLSDRCVAFVSESTCSRCETGYEDYRGRAPDACEDLCGDDKDNDCLPGCDEDLDQDCCFEQDDYYWCDDIPTGRSLESVCKAGVELDERRSCPNKYYDERGHRLSFNTEYYPDYDEELKDNYEVKLLLEFPNRELKQAVFLINGREVGLESRAIEWDYDISDYIQSGTNSIQIMPEDDLDITSMTVRLRKTS